MMTCRKALLFPPQNQQARKHHYNHAKASQICIPQTTKYVSPKPNSEWTVYLTHVWVNQNDSPKVINSH